MTPDPRPTPDAMRRCGARSGQFVCDRDAGHGGDHRGYNEQIDEPIFWKGGQLTRPKSAAETDRDALQWTLDNIYTLARRELVKLERLAYTDEERDGWRHVLRLCEKVGCQPRGVLKDNGGAA